MVIISIATGKVIFEEDTNAAGFVKAISSLKASGGGDCPELAITGILNAIYEGPDPGSPLYVFTDASAKDATDKNIRDVITMAKSEDITINFYTTGTFATIFFPFVFERLRLGARLECYLGPDIENMAGIERKTKSW